MTAPPITLGSTSAPGKNRYPAIEVYQGLDVVKLLDPARVSFDHIPNPPTDRRKSAELVVRARRAILLLFEAGYRLDRRGGTIAWSAIRRALAEKDVYVSTSHLQSMMTDPPHAGPGQKIVDATNAMEELLREGVRPTFTEPSTRRKRKKGKTFQTEAAKRAGRAADAAKKAGLSSADVERATNNAVTGRHLSDWRLRRRRNPNLELVARLEALLPGGAPSRARPASTSSPAPIDEMVISVSRTRMIQELRDDELERLLHAAQAELLSRLKGT